MQHIANIEELNKDTGGHLLTATACAPRTEFTLLGRQSRLSEIGNTWQAIRNLNEDALQYVIQSIARHNQVQKVPVQILSFEILSQYAHQLHQADCTPTTLIISPKQMRQTRQNQHGLGGYLQPLGQEIIAINDSINLRVVKSNRAQNWAILLSPDFSIWKSTPVQPVIEDCPNKPTHIHIELSEAVEYQIINPDGILTLELPAIES